MFVFCTPEMQTNAHSQALSRRLGRVVRSLRAKARASEVTIARLNSKLAARDNRIFELENVVSELKRELRASVRERRRMTTVARRKKTLAAGVAAATAASGQEGPPPQRFEVPAQLDRSASPLPTGSVGGADGVVEGVATTNHMSSKKGVRSKRRSTVSERHAVGVWGEQPGGAVMTGVGAAVPAATEPPSPTTADGNNVEGQQDDAGGDVGGVGQVSARPVAQPGAPDYPALEEELREIKAVTLKLIGGVTLNKHRGGKAQRRRIWVSNDCTEVSSEQETVTVPARPLCVQPYPPRAHSLHTYFRTTTTTTKLDKKRPDLVG